MGSPYIYLTDLDIILLNIAILPIAVLVNIQIHHPVSYCMKACSGDCKVIKTYASKKNTVRKVECNGKLYVVKKYSDEFISGLRVEEDVLKMCMKKDIPVPRVIDIREDTLKLEHIPGANCKELFESGETKSVLSGIARWLAGFHTSFNFRKRRGDCILANFIFCDDKVYGIDFEESADDCCLRDIGDMCTSILRMDPSFTHERFELVEYFLDQYYCNVGPEREDITPHLVGSLLHYSRYGSSREQMKLWAAKIKEQGLDGILRNILSE